MIKKKNMTNIFPDNFELPPPTCAFLATKARMTKRRKDKGTKMPIRKTKISRL